MLLIYQTESTTNSLEYDSKDVLFLHSAFKVKDYEMIKFILVEIRDTSLKQTNIVSLLDKKDENGQSVLHLAVSCGHIEIMRYILDNQIDLNQADSMNNSILHLAVTHKKTSALQGLLEYLSRTKKLNKLDFHMLNKEGKSALHLASSKGLFSAIDILCEYGSYVDVLDENKATPLELAISSDCDEQNKKKTIQVLIKRGANYKSMLKKVENFMIDMKINQREITNLVFEGGGIKGIAYVGALKNAQNKIFNFKNIVNKGGTSACYLVAFLI